MGSARISRSRELRQAQTLIERRAWYLLRNRNVAGLKFRRQQIKMLDIGAYGTDYQTQAYVAFMGLGALAKEDAVYPTAFVDSTGVALDGSHRYGMHFEKGGLPPSKPGAWSISPYRGNFYVQNSINRYGILSSMPLKYNSDGSLDVYLQRDSPGADKESNWLPIPPSGMFNLTVRSYQPEQSMLDGTYKLPPVTRVK